MSKGRTIIVDGHHRVLAFEKLGRPVTAYVATVHSDSPDAPWLHLHSLQKRGSSKRPASYSIASITDEPVKEPPALRADDDDEIRVDDRSKKIKVGYQVVNIRSGKPLSEVFSKREPAREKAREHEQKEPGVSGVSTIEHYMGAEASKEEVAAKRAQLVAKGSGEYHLAAGNKEKAAELAAAAGSEWDESRHPRDESGRFDAVRTDDWDEGAHPRGPDGKFGAGGSLSAKSTPFGNLNKPATWNPPEEHYPEPNLQADSHIRSRDDWSGAIDRYGGQGGFRMNGVMKYGVAEAEKKYGFSGTMTTQVLNDIDSLKAALKDAPKSPGTVLRGGAVVDPSKFKEGGTFTTVGFWSASASPEVAANFAQDAKNDHPDKTPMLFHIEQRSGVDVSRLTGFDNEKEILLPPGQLFQVMHVSAPKDADEGGRMTAKASKYTNVWLKEL